MRRSAFAIGIGAERRGRTILGDGAAGLLTNIVDS